MNSSQSSMNFKIFPICQMSIKYNAKQSSQHGKKKRDNPKSDIDSALKRKNAAVAIVDETKQRQKTTFLRLNEQ